MEIEKTRPCPAVFTGTGGYEEQTEEALKTFEVGAAYEIESGEMFLSITYLRIQGFPGRWNSVLFDFDWDKAPLTSMIAKAHENPPPVTHLGSDRSGTKRR